MTNSHYLIGAELARRFDPEGTGPTQPGPGGNINNSVTCLIKIFECYHSGKRLFGSSGFSYNPITFVINNGFYLVIVFEFYLQHSDFSQFPSDF